MRVVSSSQKIPIKRGRKSGWQAGDCQRDGRFCDGFRQIDSSLKKWDVLCIGRKIWQLGSNRFFDCVKKEGLLTFFCKKSVNTMNVFFVREPLLVNTMTIKVRTSQNGLGKRLVCFRCYSVRLKLPKYGYGKYSFFVIVLSKIKQVYSCQSISKRSAVAQGI